MAYAHLLQIKILVLPFNRFPIFTRNKTDDQVPVLRDILRLLLANKSINHPLWETIIRRGACTEQQPVPGGSQTGSINLLIK